MCRGAAFSHVEVALLSACLGYISVLAFQSKFFRGTMAVKYPVLKTSLVDDDCTVA